MSQKRCRQFLSSFVVIYLVFPWIQKADAQVKVKDILEKHQGLEQINLKITEKYWSEYKDTFFQFDNYFEITNRYPEKKYFIERVDIKVTNSYPNLLFSYADSSFWYYSNNPLVKTTIEESWNKIPISKYSKMPPYVYKLVLYSPFDNKIFSEKKWDKKLIETESYYYINTKHEAIGQQVHLYFNKSTLLIDSLRIPNHKNTLYFDFIKINEKEIQPCEYFPIDSSNLFLRKIWHERKNKTEIYHQKKDSVLANLDIKTKFNKLTLLDFWFIGCGPCHSSFPEINALRAKYPDSLLHIKAYSFDSQNEIDKYKAKYKFNFDMLEDSSKYIEYFNIKSYPTKILISPKGEILYTSVGRKWPLKKEELTEIIEKYLEENKP